jgi:hypothetical protein
MFCGLIQWAVDNPPAVIFIAVIFIAVVMAGAGAAATWCWP